MNYFNTIWNVYNFTLNSYPKTGNPKQGVRWHPAYDVDQVRALVEMKVKRTIGIDAIKGIDIAIISHSTGIQEPTKNLGLE